MPNKRLKVWIEISKAAAKHNLAVFRRLVGRRTKIWAVVKSNAYGHGIYAFTKMADKIGVDGFCVDSVIEGLTLRREGIKKFILVLGPTLNSLILAASRGNLTISIGNFTQLKTLVKAIPNPKKRPAVHIKVDTGMHRQGFFIQDLEQVADFCSFNKIRVTGIFSHFAAAKDLSYPSFSKIQSEIFLQAVQIFEDAGFTGLIKHIANSGGSLVDSKYHFDAVRVGAGLYGIYPSKELEVQLAHQLKLKPVLSWHSIISEIKTINKNEYVSYDLTERVSRKTDLAIVPIGYWHGFSWALSGKGEVLINGKTAKVLGRVTMDMIMVDVTGIRCNPGDKVTLIGRQGKREVSARTMALQAGSTMPYEVLTRINPLIERVIV